MFKVLVIAYYYPPLGLSGVQRTLKFTKYMSKFNWQPTVITTGNIAYYAHDFYLLKEAESFIEFGNLKKAKDCLIATEKGFLLSENIIEKLI